LPELNPVDSQTLNYTPVAVGIVIVLIGGSWLWARTWFTGPRRQVILESAGVNTNDPAAVAAAEKNLALEPEIEKKDV
jgi:predicted permease